MKIPRCGVMDHAVEGEGEGDIAEVDPEVEMREDDGLLRRFRRYALHGSRWKTKVLTYRVSRWEFDDFKTLTFGCST